MWGMHHVREEYNTFNTPSDDPLDKRIGDGRLTEPEILIDKII